jgi:hypothetical protein
MVVMLFRMADELRMHVWWLPDGTLPPSLERRFRLRFFLVVDTGLSSCRAAGPGNVIPPGTLAPACACHCLGLPERGC